MKLPSRFYLAVALSSVSGFAMADSLQAVPPTAIPAVKCVHRILETSSAVQSVDLYSIDGFRFATEFAFRNKAGQAVVSDIEFFELGGSVAEGDKIPREISRATAIEATDLESKLDLVSKCHLNPAFDNLLPLPKARAEWRKIDWPAG